MAEVVELIWHPSEATQRKKIALNWGTSSGQATVVNLSRLNADLVIPQASLPIVWPYGAEVSRLSAIRAFEEV